MGHALKTWDTCIALTSNTLSVRGSLHLATAYDVLEIFADEGTSALHDALRNLSGEFQRLVFQPLLEHQVAGKTRSRLNFIEVEEKGGSLTKPFNFSSTSRGPVQRIEWSLTVDGFLDVDRSSPRKGHSIVAAWQETFHFFIKFLVFVTTNVLLTESRYANSLG